jgi:GNAT superfamily N-acetyltransferase
MADYFIRATTEDDRSYIREFITRHWFGEAVVVHGEIFYPAELPGFMALKGAKTVGLVTYQIRKPICEIITLDSEEENSGVGSGLIDAVNETATESGCTRLTLVTTNDNLKALSFYHKRGFVLRAVFPGAVDKSRQKKPSIPKLGENGIPIRDEILLEMELTG